MIVDQIQLCERTEDGGNCFCHTHCYHKDCPRVFGGAEGLRHLHCPKTDGTGVREEPAMHVRFHRMEYSAPLQCEECGQSYEWTAWKDELASWEDVKKNFTLPQKYGRVTDQTNITVDIQKPSCLIERELELAKREDPNLVSSDDAQNPKKQRVETDLSLSHNLNPFISYSACCHCFEIYVRGLGPRDLGVLLETIVKADFL